MGRCSSRSHANCTTGTCPPAAGEMMFSEVSKVILCILVLEEELLLHKLCMQERKAEIIFDLTWCQQLMVLCN